MNGKKAISAIITIFLFLTVSKSYSHTPFLSPNENSENLSSNISPNISFIPAIKVNEFPVKPDARPKVAIDENGILYTFFWQDYDIRFSKSIDGGWTWSPSTIINDCISDGQYEFNIAVDKNGTLYVVWTDDRYYPSFNIFFSKSNDSGATWVASSLVTVNLMAGPYTPVIAVDDNVTGNIYVAWRDIRSGTQNNDIYFARSTNGGISWDPEIKVNDDNLPNNNQILPSMVTDQNGYLYIFWIDFRSYPQTYTYFCKSTDFGNSFSQNTPLLLPNALRTGVNKVEIDKQKNILYIGGQCDINAVSYYFVANSTNSGNSFGNASPLNTTDVPSDWWDMAVDDLGTIHAVFWDNGTFNYSQSSDGGNLWSKNVKVKDSRWDWRWPNIEARNGTPYVVWVQGKPDKWDVYFSKSGTWIWPEEEEKLILVKGWNLISISLSQNDSSMGTLFSQISGKFDRVLYYDVANKPWPWEEQSLWKMYSPGKPGYMNTLTDYSPLFGYWIYMTDNATLNISGYTFGSMKIPLYEGWNLVGYPSNNTTRTLAEVNLQVPDIVRVQVYNASQPYLLKDMQASEYFEKGSGYWIYVNKTAVWEVKW